MKKSEDIHEIKPKPTIKTPGIETFCDGGIMPLHHHKPIAFKTFHVTFFPAFFNFM
jgi:hypothetical protein